MTTRAKRPRAILKRGYVREKLQGKSFLVPSFVTVVGIFCGFLGVISAIKGNFEYATKCIILAIILDGLDGRIARRLNATSAFGREFDSLSDMISFGVAPAVLVYCWGFSEVADEFGLLAAFVFVVCGATRLARFNVESSKQATMSFTGLPTPGAAAAVIAIVLCFPEPLTNPLLVAAMMVYIVVIGVLMVSTYSFFSLKKLEFSSGNPRLNLILLAVAVALAWKYSHAAILVASTAYAWSGLIAAFVRKEPQSVEVEKAKKIA